LKRQERAGIGCCHKEKRSKKRKGKDCERGDKFRGAVIACNFGKMKPCTMGTGPYYRGKRGGTGGGTAKKQNIGWTGEGAVEVQTRWSKKNTGYPGRGHTKKNEKSESRQ